MENVETWVLDRGEGTLRDSSTKFIPLPLFRWRDSNNDLRRGLQLVEGGRSYYGNRSQWPGENLPVFEQNSWVRDRYWRIEVTQGRLKYPVVAKVFGMRDRRSGRLFSWGALSFSEATS